MFLFSPFLNLWRWFFPVKQSADALLRDALLAQLSDPLPEQGQVMVRMQTNNPGGTRWGDMQGVLLYHSLPTEQQTEEIAAEIQQIIQERGRLVIGQQKVFSDGILLLHMVYATQIPHRRNGIKC